MSTPTRISMRPFSLLLCLCLLLPLVPPMPLTAAPREELAPGPTGAATFDGVQHLFARRSDGAVWVRQTDGLWYSGWSPLGGSTDAVPAAASSADILAVFIRDATGQLWARRSLDGRTYTPWQPLGGGVATAPAAVGIGYRLYVFTLDRDGMLVVRTSADGLTFDTPVTLGGPLTAAPVAVAVDGRPVVIGTGRDGLLYRLEGGASWGTWRPLGGPDVPQHPLTSPPDPATPPLTLDLGVNFISGHNWTSYQLPAYTRLRPGLAKFTMFYDAYPTTPVFGTNALDDAIALGARTVILRTAETRIDPDEVERQLRVTLPGGTRSLLDYIRDHHDAGSGVEFWIEVGNEPDLAGVSPLAARYELLTTIRDVAPRYRASHPNLRWMASLPTRTGLQESPFDGYRGLAYLDLLLSDIGDGLGDVGSRYDALGVHIYGADTLQQSFPALRSPSERFDCGGSNGDAFCPLVVLDRVLAHTSSPVFITEAGIDSALPWAIKARFYVEALQRLPARVRGVALFTLSLDPEWYAGNGERCRKFYLAPCSRYALDVDEAGIVDANFAGSTGIGQCYRLSPEQTAATATCASPCTLDGNSPPPARPRSAVQRTACQVGADRPFEEPLPAPATPFAARWSRIRSRRQTQISATPRPASV